MPIIRWNPWNIDRFLDEDVDLPTIPFFSRISGHAMNLYETENEFVAQVPLPGIPDDKVEVTVDNGIVRVTASNEEKQEDKEKRRYFMSQLNTSYSYAFRLPEGVDPNKEPVCQLANGVLSVHFPKVPKTPPKKLKITKITNKP